MRSSPRTVFGLLLTALLLVFGSTAAVAQFNASLSGTVLDSTQAAIPGATVTLTNNATQVKQTVQSGAAGTYQFSELGPGDYTLTVTAPGFQQNVLSNVALAAETPRNLNVTLQTGQANQTVTVNANTVPALQTADASVGSTITAAQIQQLPSSGGDVYELLRTSIGITGDGARSGSGTSVFLPNGAGPGQSNTGIFQVENQVQISADGQSVGANDYTIDGVSVNSLGQAGAAVVTPNEESIAQMTVVATSYSAEDGRNSGAHIKIVSKSGTNTLHGSAYFRYDEPGLNAYNRSVDGVPSIRNQNEIRDYRGSLGGPIIKDKLFLFASYEGFTQQNDTYADQWVESPQFDAALLAQRPNTTSAAIVAFNSAPRINGILPPTCSYYTADSLPCAVVGNGIDVGSPSPITSAGPFVSNTNTGNGLDGIPDLEDVQLLLPSHSHGNQYNGRLDWYASPRDQFAVSTYITKLDGDGPSGSDGSRPQEDVPTKPLNSTGTFIYIHTFSPSLVNEFRSNFTRYFDNQIQDAGNTVNYGIPFIDIQNLPVGPDVQYGVAWASTTPGIFAENTYEVRDSVIKNAGSRTLTMGGEYRWEQDNNNLGGKSRPGYSVAGLWNFFNSAAVYEEIEADPTTGGVANTARDLRSETLGLFVQQDWKVTPTFTLNTGIRYEYFSPFHNKGEDINLPVLGPAPDELITPSLTPHHNFFNSDYTGVEPKFGFAWTPAVFKNNTVIRGGVALALNRLNFSELDNAVEDGPGVFSYGLCCGGNGNSAGIVYATGSSNSPFSYAPNPALQTTIVNGLPVTISNGVATPIGIEVYGASPRMMMPKAYLYSLEIQHQLPDTFVLTLGYQGSEAHHLPRLVNQNFLYSQPAGTQIFNAAYFLQTDSNSNYNAVNAHLTKQLHHGYQLDAVYTYSKSLDQISNGFGADSLANQTNPADNTTEWGPSDYDVRHRVTVSGIWTIPGTHGNEAIKLLTNGWQVNGIFTFHTGFPFTPVVPNLSSSPYVTNAATISPVRPYAYYGGFKASCSNQNYISGADVANTSFQLTPTGSETYRPGIGRNSFTGPCYKDTDMSFAREQSFGFRDHPVNVKFQANLFNIFNEENLLPFQNGNAGGPAAIVDAQPDSSTGGTTRASSAYGKPTGTDSGRVVEFFARLQF